MSSRVHYTTNKHFEMFTAECRRWAAGLGLLKWQLFFHHEALEMDGEQPAAAVVYDINTRGAHFYLSPAWSLKPTPALVKRFALHETLHLFLARLNTLAKCRFLDEAVINEEEEALVVGLCNILEEK